jgi:HEPN domain-containing protein
MPSRYEDWLEQAKRDLKHAERSFESQDYEWCCFAAQQASEKAVKALFQKLGANALGNSISILLLELPESIKPQSNLIDKAKELDKHYITSRYPNFYPAGAPFQYYTRLEAQRAIQYTDEIIKFCENQIQIKPKLSV